MARSPRITARPLKPVIVRLAEPELDRLLRVLERRYPDYEWASFVRLGWRDTAAALVLTLAVVDEPAVGDLDEGVGHVAIDERYTLRMALAADNHPLAIGVVHSHPQNCRPAPSATDDDMDAYYANYFASFALNRPYVSLITSRMNEELAISGRVFWHGAWHLVTRVVAERRPLRQWTGGQLPEPVTVPRRLERVQSAFGKEAGERLRRATVAVIGAGGTGSAAIEVLARAGIGRLIIVDPDQIEESNLERVHGADHRAAERNVAKVVAAQDHVRSIDPACDVIALKGALPQPEVLDAIVTADVVLGCTDQQHSRLALSDTALRYLVPALDCGVLLEGRQGHVSGQIVQIIRFLAHDSCALCRQLINPVRVTQELMSEAERQSRREEAIAARQRGENPDPYWHEEPQISTVGYLTTAAGALIAGYAIGWITGRFEPPFTRLQMNLVAPYLDVTDVDVSPDPECACRRMRGWADQANADAFISAPRHWPNVERMA